MPLICSIAECTRPGCISTFIVADIKDGNLGRQNLRVTFCEYHNEIAFSQQQSPPEPEEQKWVKVIVIFIQKTVCMGATPVSIGILL